MKKTNLIRFLAGFLSGALLFGGAAAYAAGIIAQPRTAAVVINGQTVDIKGYIIDGAHYFQLRDTAAALRSGGKDFSVVWDGTGNRIVINTSKGYDPNERLQTAQPSPAPGTTDAATAPMAGGYGTAPKILKPGDTVKTENGDYRIEAGQLERQAELERHGLEFGRPLAPDAPLPAWQSEWDNYPRVTIPDTKPVRSAGDVIIEGQKVGTRDSLEAFNAYEVERLIRTIYKYAKNNPSLWQNRDPASNVPAFTVVVERTEGIGFYPWENAVVPGETTVKNKVESGVSGCVFRVYASDSYNFGKYIDTAYFMK
jgi:hypothetical protein